MPSLKQPLQQTNHHKVPKRQWLKWPDIAQRVFNDTYATIRDNQPLFSHPKAAQQHDEMWNTTAWNAAWHAADAVCHALDRIIEGKGYARKSAS